jgi:AraC-like DNA-binding protein
MQYSPEKDWTLAKLSQHAGMSRSSFCIAFKEMVGETPLEYLTNWRMSKAKELLKQGNVKISDVAFRVGYQSEAAFSRIFKSKENQTPRALNSKKKFLMSIGSIKTTMLHYPSASLIHLG